MADEPRSQMENALLTQALLSVLAATNTAFDALLSVARAASPEGREGLEQKIELGVEHLNAAIAFIKEARHVGHDS